MPAKTREHSAASASRYLILLLLFGPLAYGLSLLVTLPASVASRYLELPSQIEALGGTVWNGSALIEGGHRAVWRLDRQATVTRLAPYFAVSLEGPGTSLVAQARIAPISMAATVEDLRGRASWPLAVALAPDARRMHCDPVAVFDISKIELSWNWIGADGTVRSNEGACHRIDDTVNASVPVPPLVLRVAIESRNTRATLKRRDGDQDLLMNASLAGGRRLAATIFPEGARMVPGLPSSAPISIEMELLTPPSPPDR